MGGFYIDVRDKLNTNFEFCNTFNISNLVVGNGATWDRFKPRTKNSRRQNLKILNFVLVSNLSQDSLHFLLLETLKNYFLYVKIFFEFYLRIV